MTKTKLSNLGIPFDTWTTLAPNRFANTQGFQRIALIGDDQISIDPFSQMFYFSSNGVLYVKSIYGTARQTTDSATVPDGYYKIQVEDKYYIVTSAPAGIDTDNENIGKVHIIIPFSQILGFYENVLNVDLYLKEGL